MTEATASVASMVATPLVLTPYLWPPWMAKLTTSSVTMQNPKPLSTMPNSDYTKKLSKRKASSKNMTSAVKDILALADDLKWSKHARASSGPPRDRITPTCSVVHPSKRARAFSESASSKWLSGLPHPGLCSKYNHKRIQHCQLFGPTASTATASSPVTPVKFTSLTRLKLIHRATFTLDVSQCKNLKMPRLPWSDQTMLKSTWCHLSAQRACLVSNPNSGNWEMSHDLCNTYYHAMSGLKASRLSLLKLIVSQYVKERLNHVHIYFLWSCQQSVQVNTHL